MKVYFLFLIKRQTLSRNNVTQWERTSVLPEEVNEIFSKIMNWKRNYESDSHRYIKAGINIFWVHYWYHLFAFRVCVSIGLRFPSSPKNYHHSIPHAGLNGKHYFMRIYIFFPSAFILPLARLFSTFSEWICCSRPTNVNVNVGLVKVETPFGFWNWSSLLTTVRSVAAGLMVCL